MIRVYDCLTQQHDLRLVLLAGGLCLLASYTVFNAVARALLGGRLSRCIWLSGAAFAAGSGIWATHFLGMLAFDSGLPVSYHLGLTLLSGLLGTAFAALGLTLIVTGPSAGRCWLGGAIIGFGIGAMHFTGMAGLRVPAEIGWHYDLVALSLVLGIGFAALACRVAFHDPAFQPPTNLHAGAGEVGGRVGLGLGLSRRDRHGQRILGVLLLALAICALHFIGMGALDLTPRPFASTLESDFPVVWTAAGVSVSATLVLALSCAGIYIDRQWSEIKTEEAERLQRLVNATFEGLLIHDNGTIVDVNLPMARLLQMSPEELIGSSILPLIAPEHHEQVQASIAENLEAAYEIDIKRADGSWIPVEILGRSLILQDRPVRVAAVRDISERREADRQIRHLAHHDGLTGLPNRSLYRDRLEQAMARARRNGELVAVFCMGIDRFKEVNGVHGHEAGDSLLCEIGRRLDATVRETDTVARIGGDEFAIVQPGITQPRAAAQLADRIQHVLGTPHEIAGQSISAGLSIGISFFPQDGDGADALLLQSEKALQRAKADGRGTYRLFEPAMDANLRARRAFEGELRSAIKNDLLSIDYQVQVGSRDRTAIGFEALARWRSQKHGNVSPGVFIPLAEETGLILDLGKWVLRRACEDAVNWPEHLRIGVNLSPLQFRQSDLPQMVAEILAETGLAPERLELEITEGVLIDDDERAFAILKQLKALGLRLAMDDFGTGYSSLSYLQRFPFDKIKIDQSFIRDLQTRPDAMAIVRAVIGLGRSLSLAVIAEGVETEVEADLLRAEGCEELQGYYFGRPMPPTEVEALLFGPDSLQKPKLTLVGS